MATLIYLHGHGSWAPSMGFTDVPKGCSLSFYTHFAKLLNQTMVAQILNNSFAGTLDRTIGEFKKAPNCRMSSLTADQKDWATQQAQGKGYRLLTLQAAPPVVRMDLAQLLDHCRSKYQGELDIRWLCCQSLSLKQVGGRGLGLNASDRTAQAGHEGEYLFKWKDAGGAEQAKWVKSDSSIHQ